MLYYHVKYLNWKINKYNIKNSYEFTNFIKLQNIPDKYILINLDVVSLFTNIKIDMAIELIDKKFYILREFTNIPKTYFFEILTFCLKSGYFSVFNKYYE